MKKTILALTLALTLQGLAAASAADNDYIMCPGDQLQVVVYGHEDLSSPPNSNITPYTVRPDGKVSFPLIGDIDVTGKTVTEFTQQLEASWLNTLSGRRSASTSSSWERRASMCWAK